ncbi:MAG: GalNAc(5)-diNAcBac-PP-undecaprenol beta-1,3-glucosyltransferase [bacterium ADurb.Bin400]|nr:MAG: GalNAc(5)-diNAcBac-PP-undecaprenol beta-1,3-glucosyltransferase [bacterium ADurb.Bin400]
MQQPLISIIVPTRNRANLIADTLLSIHKQTFPHWETVVVDDASTDNTKEIVQGLIKKDKRIRYHKRYGEIKGAPACRNQGLALASGKYTIFLDSDDIIMPHTLTERLHIIEKHPELDFVVSPCFLFFQTPGDSELMWNIIDNGQEPLERFLLLDTPWQTAGPIWKTDSLTKVGPWNETLPAWQDWEFHIRAIIAKLKFIATNKPDYYWRMTRDDSITHLSRNSTSHLPILRDMFDELFVLMQSNPEIAQKHLKHMPKVYFWMAEKWTKERRLKEGLLTWLHCYRKGVINLDQLFRGIEFIYLIYKHPENQIFRHYNAKTRMSDIAIIHSTTFRKAKYQKP